MSEKMETTVKLMPPVLVGNPNLVPHFTQIGQYVVKCDKGELYVMKINTQQDLSTGQKLKVTFRQANESQVRQRRDAPQEPKTI